MATFPGRGLGVNGVCFSLLPPLTAQSTSFYRVALPKPHKASPPRLNTNQFFSQPPLRKRLRGRLPVGGGNAKPGVLAALCIPNGDTIEFAGGGPLVGQGMGPPPPRLAGVPPPGGFGNLGEKPQGVILSPAPSPSSLFLSFFLPFPFSVVCCGREEGRGLWAGAIGPKTPCGGPGFQSGALGGKTPLKSAPPIPWGAPPLRGGPGPEFFPNIFCPFFL